MEQEQTLLHSQRPARSVQESLLSLLAHSDEYGGIVAKIVPPALFEGDYQTIATRVIEFWNTHHHAPKSHTVDLFAAIIESKEPREQGKAKTYRDILMAMEETVADTNGEVVLHQIDQFLRTQQARLLILRSAEAIEAKREHGLPEIVEMWNRYVNERRSGPNLGISFSDFDGLYAHLKAHEKNEFTSGIALFDHLQIVPERGKLMVLQGVTRTGKSWWLGHFGKQALKLHKRILHITLEMGARDVQLRYAQTLLAAAHRRRDIFTYVPRISVKPGDVLDISYEVVQAPFAMVPITKDVRRAMEDFRHHFRYRDNLRISKFPMHALTIMELRAHLDALKVTGFVPDLITLDYAGLMAIDAENLRISLGTIVKELCAVATDYNVAMVTAVQSSREGAKASRVNMTHIAEDWSITGTCDFFLSLTRSKEDAALKLARVMADKARDTLGDVGVILTQNYAHGQFVLDAHVDYGNRYEQLAESATARMEEAQAEALERNKELEDEVGQGDESE